MPKLSQKKKDRIAEQVLAILYQKSPEPQYTSTIANDLIRDEEFTKSLLIELAQKNLLIKIKKSQSGIDYRRRERWRLSNAAFEAYKKVQK